MRKYTEDEKFMKEAIRQAKKAEAIGDVPIGCVIVRDEQDQGPPNETKIRRCWPTRSCLP